MKAAEWIDRVKAVKKIESDYGVAKALGLSRASVSKYRHGTPTLDEENAVKIAQALGISAAGIIIDQVAERSKDPEARSALFSIARGLSIAAKTAMVAIVVIALCPMDSSASTVLTAASSESASYYVKYIVRF